MNRRRSGKWILRRIWVPTGWRWALRLGKAVSGPARRAPPTGPVFTQEDVKYLRDVAVATNTGQDNYELTGSVSLWATSLADRLEAAL